MRPYRPAAALAVVLALGAGLGSAFATQRTTYAGRFCPPPKGHLPGDCRVAVHGAPDLSRDAWRALRGAEVTVQSRVRGLAPNPAAGGARDWPLVDSLGQPMGRVRVAAHLELVGLDGTAYRVGLMVMRGHGCAASAEQQRDAALVQIIARDAPASGTQAFLPVAAFDAATRDGAGARRRFAEQPGGGTGCGPARPERGRVRTLRDPRVGAVAHARLGHGELNTVTEYDAKPAFGNVLYFSSNTTSVRVGGITRGMVRVGTPVATVDRFGYCDANSDGTLTWRYVAIHAPGGRRLYGWIPAPCPARLRR